MFEQTPQLIFKVQNVLYPKGIFVNLWNNGNVVVILLSKQYEYVYTLTSELGQHKSDISYTCIVHIRCIHVCPCVYERCDSSIMALQRLQHAGVFIIQTTGKFLFTQCLCWLIYREKTQFIHNCKGLKVVQN